jgi:hypothetical protein
VISHTIVREKSIDFLLAVCSFERARRFQMRSPRLKLTQSTALYHCISRTTGGLMLLDDAAKEQFRKMMVLRQLRLKVFG